MARSRILQVIPAPDPMRASVWAKSDAQEDGRIRTTTSLRVVALALCVNLDGPDPYLDPVVLWEDEHAEEPEFLPLGDLYPDKIRGTYSYEFD